VLFEDLREDGDSRVDWVGNHENESLGSCRGDTSGEITADASVDLEEIVTDLSIRRTDGVMRGGSYRVIYIQRMLVDGSNRNDLDTRTPGLRGTPAGMTTMSASLRAFSRPPSGLR
jgi:hypothetical protein